MSVVTWFKNLLIGLIVAVYLLASRKKFAKQAKMILYSVVKAPLGAAHPGGSPLR